MPPQPPTQKPVVVGKHEDADVSGDALPPWSMQQAIESMERGEGATKMRCGGALYDAQAAQRIEENQPVLRELRHLADSLPNSCPPRLIEITKAQVESFEQVRSLPPSISLSLSLSLSVSSHCASLQAVNNLATSY
eukprot:COSAG04_NODE_10757_length_755_cov_1.048780_1_plen_135_part_01